MKRQIFILAILGLLSLELSKAQQTPVYSQYMMNGFLLNPATAGAEGYTAVNVTAREQWLGFKNAPGTYALSGQTRITKTSQLSKLLSIRKRNRRRRPSGKVGLGGYIYNDQNGAIRRTGVQLSYAYHLFINNSQLSFGLSGSLFQFKANVSQSDFVDGLPDELVSENNSTMVPDANFGVYYKTFQYYVGFSAVQLLQSSLKFSDRTASNFKMLRHYYLTGGYSFDLTRDYEFEPSVLLKSTENLTMQADINVKGYYKKDYWLGLSYRTSGALVGMVGFKYDKYQFGYAFDYSFNEMSRFSYGSHEIMIGIKFGDNRRRYRWLNRF